METKVRICVKKGVWYTPHERARVQVYDRDVVEILQKSLQDGKYRDVTKADGKNLFKEVTDFLKERGRKLPGGRSGWEEYYEIDIADAIELYRKFNVPCPDAKVLEV
ncbi:MAG: hypothetical protein J7K48_08035 [Thermococcus sp.]|nr:hypothetical protein [Thermococcus sp.]